MLKKTDFTEKRQFGRRPTSMRAWAKVGGRPPQPCIVRDLSDGGALIEFDAPVWLPFSFRLTSETGEIDRVCEIRHQSERRFGVEFVAAGETYASKNADVTEKSGWMGARPAPRR
mgnify:CR=1 FL=1